MDIQTYEFKTVVKKDVLHDPLELMNGDQFPLDNDMARKSCDIETDGPGAVAFRVHACNHILVK